MGSVYEKAKDKGRAGGKSGGQPGNPVRLVLGSGGGSLQDSPSQLRCVPSPSRVPRALRLMCSAVGFSTFLLNNSSRKMEQLLTELLKV